MKDLIFVNRLTKLLALITKAAILLLAISMFLSSALAQTSWDIQQQVDNEVDSLLAEIESNQDVVELVADKRAVYNRNSKRKIGDVLSSSKFSVIENQKKWLLVRFDEASVAGWVSRDYVSISEKVATVNTAILNLRSQPSASGKIIERLPRGYSSSILGSENGFVKLFAPLNLVVALKKETVNKLGKKRSVSQPVVKPETRGINTQPGATLVGQVTTKKQQKSELVNNSKATQAALDKRVSKKPSKGENTHIIAPGDAISLLVFGEEDLSVQNVRVPQGGQVSLPLIGSISVAGKTTSEVEKDIYKLLSQGYVRNPRLSVSIFSYRPIFIRGAVRQTGSFPFTAGLTISKAIALAGGSKNSAKKQGVSILRDGEVVLESLSVDSQVEVSSGDVISISEEFGVSEDEATYVYLHGEVVSPGEYLFRRGLTVEKAVVLAGGFTLRASRKKVSITRYINSSEGEKPEKMKKVRLYTPVQPGDIIDVGASWF